MSEYDLHQEAVEKCADNVKSMIGTFGFLAVHFLCGEEKKPGFVRKSAVRLGESFLSNIFYGEAHPTFQQNSKVLRSHVRRFEREHTLLKLALKKSMVKNGNPSEKFYFRVGGDDPSDLPSDWRKGNLVWPDKINEFLVPFDKAKAYLKSVYKSVSKSSDNTKKSNTFIKDFEMQRSAAFGRWLVEKEKTDSTMDKRKDEYKPKDIWKYINPLQSSLIYFTASRNGNSPINGDFLVFRLKPVKDGNNSIVPLAVVVISPSLNNFTSLQEVECEIRESLSIDSVRDHIKGHKNLEAMKNILKFKLSLNEDNSKPLILLIEKSSRALPIPGHRDRFQLLSLWFALLTKELAGHVHEGKKLEFWFVAGDLSEFEDDSDILFDKRFTNIAERTRFSPPAKTEALEGHSKTAVKLLEKEHFPWFEDGRCALFFDLASEHMEAIGLCGIKHSTWSHLYSEVYKSVEEQHGENGIKTPMCLVGYVSERHGGAGIGFCHPQATKEKKKLNQLLRLRNGTWQTATDKRNEELLKLLQSVAGAVPLPNKKQLAELCILIADNPHAGGTVVLLEADNFDDFLQMGKPWEFGIALSASDKSSLMAHDGATLVSIGDINKSEYRYRYILTPNNIDKSIIEKLKEVGDSLKEGSPLAGVGTRRWSGLPRSR
jgi:hypothetical protein